MIRYPSMPQFQNTELFVNRNDHTIQVGKSKCCKMNLPEFKCNCECNAKITAIKLLKLSSS